MNKKLTKLRAAAAVLLIASTASCATVAPPPLDPATQWAANAWYSPAPAGDPEIIGVFSDRRDCEEAARAWMERQVVGAPVFAACLPLDQH